MVAVRVFVTRSGVLEGKRKVFLVVVRRFEG